MGRGPFGPALATHKMLLADNHPVDDPAAADHHRYANQDGYEQYGHVVLLCLLASK